jgi:hypothetical protein
MSNLKTALVTFTQQSASIFALLGNRVTVDHVPDGQDYPHAVLTQVGSAPKYTHDKRVTGRKVKLQLDIFAETLASADACQDAIETALSGYAGMLGTVTVGYVFVADLSGLFDSDTRKIHRLLQLEIGHNA